MKPISIVTNSLAAGIAILCTFSGVASAAVLEEIVVTATKRSAALQEVPVAITALTGAELQKAGVNDIRALQGLVPSFILTSTSSETGGTTARMRGVGTQGNNPGLESAVAMYVDGVYRNRSTVGFTDLGALDRIEVLRGPQGTLFGRNSSVGVLNVVTKAPSVNEGDGYVRISAGDYSLVKAQAGFGGPIGDNGWAAGADLLYHTRDGVFEDDALTGEAYNSRERAMGRLQLVYDNQDSFRMRLIGDMGTRDETCCTAMYLEKGWRTDPAIESLDPNTTLTSDADDPYGRVSYTTPGRNLDAEVDEYGLSGELVWTWGGNELTSITAYRDWDSANGGDLDYSGGDILYRDPENLVTDFATFTQELRLAGTNGSLDWLVGVFFIDEQLDTTLQTRVGAQYSDFTRNVLGVSADASLGLPPGTVGPTLPPFSAIGAGTADGDGSNDIWTTDTQSIAVFTHNTWSMTDRAKFTIGLRYTDEEKDLNGTVSTIGTSCAGMLAFTGFDPLNPSGPITQSLGGLTNGALALQCLGGTLNSTLDGTYADTRSEDQLSGTLSLSYDFSDDVMGYFTYANGYKAGGYNLDRSGLDPDTVLDGATSGPNAATNFGIETDVNALEFEEERVDSYELGLKSTIAGGTTNLNFAVYYQDFENFQLNTFNGLTFFVVTLDKVTSKGAEMDLQWAVTDKAYTSLGVAYNDARYDDNVQRSDGLPSGNLAGQRLTHAPEWSVTGTLNLESDLGAGPWGGFLYLDARWTGGHNTGSDLDPEKYQPGYTVVNARVGLRSDDDRWTVSLWGQNLLDEEYVQTAFDTPIQNTEGAQILESYSAFLGDPALWGLTLDYRF